MSVCVCLASGVLFSVVIVGGWLSMLKKLGAIVCLLLVFLCVEVSVSVML